MEKLTGEVVSKGRGNVVGPARVCSDVTDVLASKDGDILVCEMTTPDMMAALPRMGAIVTTLGGRLCHAAIVAKQLGLPCIVGVRGATQQIQTGTEIMVNVETGAVTAMEMATAKERMAAWSAAADAGRSAAPALDMRSRWGSFGEDV